MAALGGASSRNQNPINIQEQNPINSKKMKDISKLSENGDVLNDNKIIVYSDALYRLGNYNEAIKNLAYLSEIYPADGKYFLLALYNKKLGNINGAVTFLDNLISDYPNSEYYKLAKLQMRILK